jgi:hypothetical protein
MAELTTQEKFKIYLIQYDLFDQIYMDAVAMVPELLKKYSFEELAFILMYLRDELKPTQFTPKFRPIVYNALRLKAMRDKKSIIDTLNNIISSDPDCSSIIKMEMMALAGKFKKKIEAT